jgi:hypothetical protein
LTIEDKQCHADKRGGRRIPMRTAIAAIALTLATTATGGIQHTVLHGVSVGAVRVWTGPQTIPGLNKETLQGIVESSLRKAGIALDPASPVVLGLNVTVMVADSDPRLNESPSPDAACFATLDARLSEDALLVRNGLRVEASSWSRGASVAVHVDTCATRITEATQSAVADFVETFRAMNPGTPTTR